VGGKTTKEDLLSKKIIHFDKREWTVWKDEEGNTVPPIVSEELWDKCNSIIKERAEKMSSENKTSYQNKYVYSGKLICGKHKTSYWHNKYKYKSGEKTLWQCAEYRRNGKNSSDGCNSPHIYSHELDYILKEVLKDVFIHKDLMWNKLQDIYKQLIAEINFDNDIKQCIGKIEILKKKKSKLLTYNAAGDITDKEYLEMSKEIKEEIDLLEKQISQYEELNDSKKSAEETLKLTKKWFEKDVEINNDNVEELISKFLDRVEVFGSKDISTMLLKVILKSGVEIPTFFKRSNIKGSEDMRLLPITHMECIKRTLKFTRRINNIETDITADIDVVLDIAI
jgi:hypothetical protein